MGEEVPLSAQQLASYCKNVHAISERQNPLNWTLLRDKTFDEQLRENLLWQKWQKATSVKGQRPLTSG